jgi:RNA-directed DNA polymerase
VQAALKLVLEPIFEADFKPCSYCFRTRRRAQDAIAEIHHLASPSRNYERVFESDIKACFDEIDHAALMDRARHRVGDKRLLGWAKAFLRAGVLTEDGLGRETITGTPQGGLLYRCWPTSPCPFWTSISSPSGQRSDRSGLHHRRAGGAVMKSSATRTTSSRAARITRANGVST